MITNIRKIQSFIWCDALNDTSYKFYFFTQFMEIFFSVAALSFLAGFLEPHIASRLAQYGGDYFSFALLGIASTGYIGVSVRTFEKNIRSAQVVGTFEALFATSTPPEIIVAGLGAYGYLWTTLRVAVYILIGGCVFGFNVSRVNITYTILLLILSIFAFSAIGILSAAFTVVFKKGNPLAWVFIGGSEVLAGIAYPVDVLPKQLQKIAWCLPLTHSLAGMRKTVLIASDLTNIWDHILYLGVFSVVMVPVSLVVFRYAVSYAKKCGGLADY